MQNVYHCSDGLSLGLTKIGSNREVTRPSSRWEYQIWELHVVSIKDVENIGRSNVYKLGYSSQIQVEHKQDIEYSGRFRSQIVVKTCLSHSCTCKYRYAYII